MLESILAFHVWKEKVCALHNISEQKYWYYEMYGRYCNNQRAGRWGRQKLLPCSITNGDRSPSLLKGI